ncbi:MAG: OB-fold nucleic acid binding domain-containing protein, partial [Hyphomonas sp.]
TFAVRLGFRQIDGLSQDDMERLMARRGAGYDTPGQMMQRAQISRSVLERLAAADAFGSLNLTRREALWKVRGEAPQHSLPLFAAADLAEQGSEADITLPAIPPSEHVLQDYQTTRLSLKNHPMHFLRPLHARRGVLSTQDATSLASGRRVQTSGIVLVRQRPGTASGVVFITLEDETGVANLVVWPRVMERFRAVVMRARIIQVKGRVQTAEGVTHIVAEQLIDCTAELKLLSEDVLRDPLKTVLARSDEVTRPVAGRTGPPRRSQTGGHPRDVRVIPPSRDFH